MDTIDERLQNVCKRIVDTARKANRRLNDIKLIAVSKTQDEEAIIPVIKSGQTRFGENRIQEARQKWPSIKQKYPNTELHLIGPLQSNKVKDAVSLFDVIHTVDRMKIARSIAAEMKIQHRRPRLFIQVNTGEEPQKSGVLPTELTNFVQQCQEECDIEIQGLMCIPPIEDEPSLHFALLAKKAKELGLKELSMGMSADYETAIEFGATYIRVGTALFGERQT